MYLLREVMCLHRVTRAQNVGRRSLPVLGITYQMGRFVGEFKERELYNAEAGLCVNRKLCGWQSE